MPKGATTEVEGVATFVTTLGAARDDLAVIAPPDAGAYVRDEARDRAPKVSGRLATSITATESAATVEVGSSLVYAPVIHNGWAAHNIAANPFLIPVAEETAPIWGKAYDAETGRILKQVRGA